LQDKYISLEEWCNNIGFVCDLNLEYEGQYRLLLDYLYSPENFELLSKFWKDGVGHFAFIREEIVLNKACIKIGKKLQERCQINYLFAVPEEYGETMKKLITEIVKNIETKKKSKSKVQEMLHSINKIK